MAFQSHSFTFNKVRTSYQDTIRSRNHPSNGYIYRRFGSLKHGSVYYSPWRGAQLDMEKRLKPETACTDCGAPGSNITLTEDYGNCWRVGCKGRIQTAIGENDWAECPSCAATGWEGGKDCSQCDGAGWLFVRGRKP